MEYKNAKITHASVRFERGQLAAGITLDGNGWGCGFGFNYIQGEALDLFMSQVMQCVGVTEWHQLEGCYVRVEDVPCGGTVRHLAHIVEDDKTFSVEAWAEEARARVS